MKKTSAVFMAVIMLFCLTGVSACSQKEDTSYRNEYSLTKVILYGTGDNSDDYKIAFMPGENTQGVTAYLIGFSVKTPKEVKEYLSGFTKDEILNLDKPVNRAYVITDLSYADGIGNTLNSGQKDIVTGQDFSEQGEYYFYACAIGENGLLGIEKANRTVKKGAVANKLNFTRNGNNIEGSYVSYDDGIINETVIFYSALGYEKTKEEFVGKSVVEIDTLVQNGRAVKFSNNTENSFTLDLNAVKDVDGNGFSENKLYYVYLLSVSAEKVVGISYNDGLFIEPTVYPEALDKIGSGVGCVFPNGGAAIIDGSRNSIISDSQKMFSGIDKPRIAIIGASGASEAELSLYFNYEADGVKSYIDRFDAAGFTAVYIPLTIDNYRTVGESDYFKAVLESCHGVYFLGGNQFLAARSLLRDDGSYNKIGQAVIDMFNKGGIIMGSSAGAHVISDPCFQDGVSYDALKCNGAEYVDICLVIGASSPAAEISGNNIYYKSINVANLAIGETAVFDSHFDARGRLGRLIVLARDITAKYAIGLDENTGLAVSDGVGVCIGTGGVTIVDTSEAIWSDGENFAVQNVKIHYLTAGDSFDFKTGKYTPNGKSQVSSRTLYAENTDAIGNIFGAAYETTRGLLSFVYGSENSHTFYAVGENESDIPFKVTVEKRANTELYYSNSKYSAANALTSYNKGGYTNLYISICLSDG